MNKRDFLGRELNLGDFDNTYADIYFKVPNDEKMLLALRGLEAGTSPEKQWEELFKLVK